MIVIMTKLQLVRKLRAIAADSGCKLTLKAASAIADWIRTVYEVDSSMFVQLTNIKDNESSEGNSALASVVDDS